MMTSELDDIVKMPGYDLLGSYQAGIPFYKVKLKVKARKKQSLETLTEYVLKMIGLGIVTEEEICAALGVDNIYIRNALEHLSTLQLIKSETIFSTPGIDIRFSLTGKGREALDNTLTANFETFISLQVDGITGDLSPTFSNDGFIEGAELRKLGIWLLHTSGKVRPSLENLNDEISRIGPIYKAQQDESDNTDQLIEILEILRPWLVYKIVKVLVFQNRQKGELKLRVFDGFESVPDYDVRLTDRERNGGRVIPDDLLVKEIDHVPSNIYKELKINTNELQQQQDQIDKLVQEKKELEENDVKGFSPVSDIVTSRTKRIQELEMDLKSLQEKQATTRLITGAEHYRILKDALKKSNYSVIIISPWIKKDVVDEEMIKIMKDAIKRGIWIIIGYGMPLRYQEKKEDYIDEWVLDQFRQIQKQPQGNKLFLIWLGNTHEKLLISDHSFSVVTSYNWLSYRGDKGFRRETGTYSEDPKIVSEVLKHAMSGIKLEIPGFHLP
jgi:hypothetical protein